MSLLRYFWITFLIRSYITSKISICTGFIISSKTEPNWSFDSAWHILKSKYFSTARSDKTHHKFYLVIAVYARLKFKFTRQIRTWSFEIQLWNPLKHEVFLHSPSLAAILKNEMIPHSSDLPLAEDCSRLPHLTTDPVSNSSNRVNFRQI